MVLRNGILAREYRQRRYAIGIGGGAVSLRALCTPMCRSDPVNKLLVQPSTRKRLRISARRGLVTAGIVALVAVAIDSPHTVAAGQSLFEPDATQGFGATVPDSVLGDPTITLKGRARLGDWQRKELLDDPDSVVGGNPEGNVTVVEFFDYRCGYCKVVASRLVSLLKEDGNIRFIYKEFPILGPASQIAARAALAAAKQEKYVAFHDALMAVHGPLNENKIFDIATRVGMNLRQLRQDMASPEIDAALRRTKKLARSLNIRGTPAFVIGDAVIPGAIRLVELKAFVEWARSG